MARALAEIEQLTILIRPGDFRRFLSDMDAALEEKGIGNVTVRDAEVPRQVGILTKDGFVPQVFTDDHLAREFAVATGLIEPHEAMAMTTARPADVLFDCLSHGWPGVVLDDQSSHTLNLHRPTVARLYALLTQAEFVGLHELHVITHAGEVLYQRPPDKPGLQAYVFDSPEAAAAGLQEIRGNGADVAVAAMETRGLLQAMLRAGVTALVVNPSLPTARHYDRDDLVAMAGDAAAPVERAATAQPEAAPSGDAGLEPRTARDAAAARPVTPAARPPARDDDAAREAFLRLRRAAEERTIGIWEYVEALAFDVDHHVPIHPEPVDGSRWPQMWRHPEDERKRRCLAFTRRALLEQCLAAEPPEKRESFHLSGIEAMRWVDAAPATIDEIGLDTVSGSEAWLTYPARWVLTAVYPQIANFDDLHQVAAVGLSRIGGLPGARGLKPEVVRSLVDSWREIAALVGEDGAASPPVEHAGGRYRPVFSDHKQYSAFCAANRGYGGLPARAGGEAPFGDWLASAVAYDGVVLDPAGPAPLVLDHTDLLVLSLWARDPSRRPRGREIVLEVARLRASAGLPASLAGRIVADWPSWFIGLARGEGSQIHVLQVPLANDACAIFTSQEAVEDYLTVQRNLGIFQAPEGMAPQAVAHRWRGSVFGFALEQFTEAWIDPEPMGGAPVVMDRELLAVAAARVEERLRPRVPGFAEP
jgi:hypothetical protein